MVVDKLRCYYKIERVVESCVTLNQLDSAYKLVILFGKKFDDADIELYTKLVFISIDKSYEILKNEVNVSFTHLNVIL